MDPTNLSNDFFTSWTHFGFTDTRLKNAIIEAVVLKSLLNPFLVTELDYSEYL